jgi:PAS domain S-box-containing protein
VGRHFTGSLVPESVPQAIAGFKRVLAGESIAVETVALDKNAQPLNIELSGTPIIKDGVVVGTRGIIRDITQRKTVEKKLRESEAILRSIIDSVTESVLLIEPDGTVLVANRTLAERLGTTIDGLIGKCAYDFMPPDLAASRKQQIEKVVRTGEPVVFEDMRGQRYIMNSVNPIKDSSGKVIRVAIFGLDVTHLVEIQEALRESELRYRSLFESSPVGLGLSTTDGKILDCNSTMLGMIGYSIAEIGQVNLKDTYVNLQARARLLKELATNGLVRDFEVRLKRKDGTAYWASLSVIPFPFGGENTMLAVQVDITERKQVEEDLRDARNILRRIIDMLPVRVFWKNKDLKYLGCNEAFVKDAGLKSVDEIVGKNDFDLVWKNQAELFRAGDKEVIETGRPKLTYEEPSTAPSGNAIWVNTSKVPLKNAEGETIGVLGVYSDITAQKQMQDALRQSENKYKTLLENLPQRVFLKDKNSVYISCNESYARDLRIKADQIVGKTDYDFYPKELAEKYKADDRRVVESGQTIDIEEKYILEGRELIVHTVKTPVADEQGNVIGMLGIFWDITDSKRRERELNLYHEKLTQTERLASLGTLSATVAHELTQPLTTIRLSIENSLVDLEATSCPADALGGLKDGLEGVEYAVAIIDRFRNFARQSSDKAITEVELKEVAERIVRLLDKNAQQADISLQLKDLERLPPIYANEKDMEQLFFRPGSIQGNSSRKCLQ